MPETGCSRTHQRVFSTHLPDLSHPRCPEARSMNRPNRRSFLKTTLATAATVTVAGTKSSGIVLGANDSIRVAVAGINGRGGSHIEAFGKMSGVEVVYLADPDTRTFKKRQDQLKKLGRKEAVAVQDFRKVLDDKS